MSTFERKRREKKKYKEKKIKNAHLLMEFPTLMGAVARCFFLLDVTSGDNHISKTYSLVDPSLLTKVSLRRHFGGTAKTSDFNRLP